KPVISGRLQERAPRSSSDGRGPLLKPGEVARQLGVSRSWVYAAAKDGRIPCVRLGGDDGPVRFVAQDLADWLARARAAWRPGASGAESLRRARGASAPCQGADPDRALPSSERHIQERLAV